MHSAPRAEEKIGAFRYLILFPIFRIPLDGRGQISSLIRTVPSHRGAARDRHGRGAGCGGRGSARDERGLPRTAKSCGSDAPTPASSLREEAQATVSNKRGHREEHEGNRKTIARGMPGRSGVTVVTMLVCFFHCTRGCGRIERPAFPAPSVTRGREIQVKLARKSRGEIAKPCQYTAGCLKCEVGKLAPPYIASQRVARMRAR